MYWGRFFTKDYNLQNGINLTTIHSSKGLEFDIVLCPYLSIISNKSNKIKGPIWKSNIDRKIYLNISNNCGKVEKFKLTEEKDLFHFEDYNLSSKNLLQYKFLKNGLTDFYTS